MHAYTAVIEHCPDTRLYVGHVPGFRGAHSQGATLDELHANLRDSLVGRRFLERTYWRKASPASSERSRLDCAAIFSSSRRRGTGATSRT